jgi:hypothetical protein
MRSIAAGASLNYAEIGMIRYSKTQNNQAGFGAIGLIVVLAAVLAIGATGWLVYQRGKAGPTKATNAADQPTNSNHPLAKEPKTSATMKIKEWKVKIPLSENIKDAYYVVGSSFPKDSDGRPSGVFLGLRSLTDASCDPDNNNKGGTGAIGAILRVPPDYKDPVSGQLYNEKYPSGKVIGDYYYAYQSWSSRSSCKDKEAVSSSNTSFEAAVKQVQSSAD